ncbi:ABC transporter permease subunit [Paenibacillus sacheonensis]|uniref:ABC transporter permease subunit n=1 Tax=Paenibacillus sacheonensis TaxID=742054 RepID=A0A7X5BZD7_9BACL|nr:ABC transporter permease subunit [Paenibacillus sacheonensis]MBM7566173.1 ABC-type polysaccharide transport system permease subunit [Paenibacillus sacheonensis]NBC70381.1 ABC transporter permease subunit [Paenibacillus sacheonensis]
MLSKRNKIGWTYFLVAMPFMIYVIAFYFVPLFGWIYSFYNYNPALSFSQLKFVGFDNFVKIFHERSEIFRVLKNTLAMSFLMILITPLPMFAAVMINEIKHNKFKRFIQTVTTLPNFISWIVVFALSFAIFSNEGLYYTLLRNLHIDVPVIGIMGNNGAAWFFQAGLYAWKTIGWTMIIYMAAIAGIDSEQYEAARIDGADKFGLMRHITIPGLGPTLFVLLLLQISNLLNNGLDQFFVFYNPLVADKLDVLDYYIYKVGWGVSDYSYATVLGMVKSLLGIGLLFAVNYLSKKTKGESIL